MSFESALRREADFKLTENGGRARKNTNGGAMLDLFATIGAMRSRGDKEIIDKWLDARAEDETLADNLVLYARDIRNGGCGERRVGRLLLKELAKIDPAKVARNIDKIVDAGRWDDVFVLFDTPVEDDMIAAVKKQLKSDVVGASKNQPISVLGKWMPSPNTSSAKTRASARRIRTKLGLTEATYRKTLSMLRKHLNVVETLMSSGQWDKLNFESIPSLAMKRYTRAYNHRCYEAFMAYKESLKKGEAKVNAATLYPYDIVQTAFAYGNNIDPVQEAQWKALPNYVEDENVLFVVDTSGSMTWDSYRPIATAVGLGIYFAQRNTGAYHNLYMNFDTNPKICKIQDNWSLERCINEVKRAPWGGSTDLDRTFQLIYNIAAKEGEAPKAICIVSDMEINCWHYNGDKYFDTITEKWRAAFEQIGLEMPKLIYWNVDARSDTFHAQANDNVAFVSGYGVGPFKNFQKLLNYNAVEAMREILSQEAFSWR